MKSREPIAESNDVELAVEQLLEESAKLRSIAHLIENQRDPEYAPLDSEEINRGLAAILNDSASKIREVSCQLERPTRKPKLKVEEPTEGDSEGLGNRIQSKGLYVDSALF